MPLTDLKQSAEQSAKQRGHELGEWEITKQTDTRTVALAKCHKCLKWVQVDTAPPPDGISIGGPAVAVGCAAPADDAYTKRDLAERASDD